MHRGPQESPVLSTGTATAVVATSILNSTSRLFRTQYHVSNLFDPFRNRLTHFEFCFMSWERLVVGKYYVYPFLVSPISNSFHPFRAQLDVFGGVVVGKL